jgi:transposase InsO family protein
VGGTIVQQDQDAVFTSYAWLRALLLDAGTRVSYSENGAKGNPWIGSFWARFKHENQSLLRDARSLDELQAVVKQQMRYYSRERRHSGLGYQPPLVYLHTEGFAA